MKVKSPARNARSDSLANQIGWSSGATDESYARTLRTPQRQSHGGDGWTVARDDCIEARQVWVIVVQPLCLIIKT